MADPIIRLELYETRPIVPLKFYPAGVFEIKLFPQGNSLLSTLFVKSSAGATVTVSYHEATTGEDDGEDFLLESHVTPADGLSDKIIVNKIHNKPRIRVTITGAGATIGVYVTVVSSFAGDLDSSLFKDNSASDLSVDLGSQQVIYDPILGRHFFVTGSMGVQNVAIEDGDPVLKKFIGVSIPSSNTMISTSVVPSGKSWRLRLLQGQCRAFGYFTVVVNSVTIAKTNSGPASENPKFAWSPFFVATAGETVEIWYNQGAGPVVDLSCFLFITEVNS